MAFQPQGLLVPASAMRGWNKGSYRRGIFIARRERNVNQVLVRLCVKMKRTAEGAEDRGRLSPAYRGSEVLSYKTELTVQQLLLSAYVLLSYLL